MPHCRFIAGEYYRFKRLAAAKRMSANEKHIILELHVFQ
jgi:hypothetical protein